MAGVAELSAPYANVMRGPRPGPGVCRTCFNLTDGYERCYACAHGGDRLDLVAPISYSVAGEQLHHALAAYKRPGAEWAEPFVVGLAAVLWRFLAAHEPCLSAAAGVGRCEIVTVVPSGDRARDEADGHPLRRIVGELVGPTRERHRRLLRRTGAPTVPHRLDVDRFAALGRLQGEDVLLVDDTWTSGGNAQSAAVALKRAGAGRVVAVVIGRHLNRDWGDNDARLRAMETPYDWTRCPFCATAPELSATRRRSPVASSPRRSP